jgi:hypothetical protein
MQENERGVSVSATHVHYNSVASTCGSRSRRMVEREPVRVVESMGGTFNVIPQQF